MRKINESGRNLIKSFEGLELSAYQDSVGVWTIGFGHTRGVKEGQTITEAGAERLLEDDLSGFEKGVEAAVTVPLTDNQFAALVSFAFNLGLGSLRSSTLLKKLNAGKYLEAADEMLRWNRAGGVVLRGLTKRRAMERALFLKGDK
jgi:lysozyme